MWIYSCKKIWTIHKYIDQKLWIIITFFLSLWKSTVINKCIRHFNFSFNFYQINTHLWFTKFRNNMVCNNKNYKFPTPCPTSISDSHSWETNTSFIFLFISGLMHLLLSTQNILNFQESPIWNHPYLRLKFLSFLPYFLHNIDKNAFINSGHPFLETSAVSKSGALFHTTNVLCGFS